MKKVGTQRIETDRLILRQYRVEDADDMYRNWASDPEVTRFLTWPAHGSIEVTQYVVNSWVSSYEDGAVFHWAIELKASGHVIGDIAAVKVIPEIDAAEIGYCLGRAFWGQGIMPEALKAVILYLFEQAGMNRICAGHDVNNPKSGRVMDKAGMKLEGILRQAGLNNTGICDMVMHAIIRSDLKDTCK